MRSSNTEKQAEARILCAITLTCYVTTVAGVLAATYSVLSLASLALDRNIFDVYTRQLF